MNSESATASTEPGTGRPGAHAWQARAAVAVLAVSALVALFWPRGDGTFQAPGGFLTDAGGRPTTLGSQLSPVSLVHFWATWCPPCIEEIPAIRRLASDLSSHPELTVIMVAVADSAEKVEPFVGGGAEMVLYDANWDVAKRYGTSKLPETYLVVRGTVVKKWIGATDWNDPAVRRVILGHLAGGEGPETAALAP